MANRQNNFENSFENNFDGNSHYSPPISPYEPDRDAASNASPRLGKVRASANRQYELLEPQQYIAAQAAEVKYSSELSSDVRRRTRRTWGWIWEASSVLTACGCFAGIIAMLVVLQDEPVPDWPSGITVNAILSILVTLMKGSIAVAIAECLSQLKWSWFRKERKLVDLIIFDEASRGPWGASRMLFSVRGWFLAYLGAFILIAAIIVGPTVQQTVEVRVRQIPVDGVNASLPVCNASYFDIVGLGPGPGQNRVNLPVAGAMYDGILQTSIVSPLTPGCPTGNCTFPRYQSLGIVSECQDISSELVAYWRPPEGTESEDLAFNDTTSLRKCADNVPVCTVELPGFGLTLVPYGLINSTVNSSEVTDFPELPKHDPPFYTWRAILGPGQNSYLDPVPEPVAVECKFYFSVNTYESTVDAGKLNEKVISTSFTGSSIDDPNSMWMFGSNLTIPAKPCYINGTELDDVAECTYKIDAGSGLALYNTLNSMLTGDGWRSVSNRPDFSSDVMQSILGFSSGKSLEDPKVASFEYVERAFQSLATTLTNHVRGSPDVCGGATIMGTLWADELYLHVRWAWMAPTAVMLFLTLAFFGAVTVKFSGEDLWKSSPLAFLFSRLKADGKEVSPNELLRIGGDGDGSPVDRRSVEKAAKGFTVSFGPAR